MCRRLWLCLIMPLMALRGPQFPTRPQDSHAMLLSSLQDPQCLIPDLELNRLCSICFEDAETVLLDRHAVEPSSSEAHRGRIIDRSHSEATTSTSSPQFRMDLHCAYHQGPGLETDRCTALRHAIQDLIDQGLVHLGQSSVTQNPLPAHTTHADDTESEPIELGDIYEMSSMTLRPQMPTSFRLVLEEASLQTTIVDSPTFTRYSVQTPFVLVPDVEEPPPAAAARPLEGTYALEEVRSKDDEILRHLQSTQARIFIWSLLASSSTHRDALTRALSQIRVSTTTTPEGIIHMMMVGRRVPSILLDNGSALNVCPLATAIALGYAPSDFGPSTQTIRAYDSTRREKVKFIHEGQVVTVQSTGDVFISAKPVLQISHSDDDLLLIGFTFDEVQTLEMEDFFRDLVAMLFDQHGSTVVLDMMRGMSYLPGMGLGRRQHRPSEFMTILDHDVPFGFGFIPTEADYIYIARLRKERGIKATDLLDMIIGGLSITQEADLQHLVRQLHLNEIDEHGTFAEVGDIVDGAAPHDEYIDEMPALSSNQIEETVQPGLPHHLTFLGHVDVVKGASDFVDPPLLFDILSGFVSRHDYIFDIDDEIAWHDSDDDSSSVSDSDPIDQRDSPAVRDTEIVDFGAADQPRELRIGSDLFADERTSSSNCSDPTWTFSHGPMRTCLALIHPSSSIVKEEIQKQLSVGLLSVVEYPEWLANVVPVPKKDDKYDRSFNVVLYGWIFRVQSSLMAPEDMEKTSFITKWDDMIMESRDRPDHLAALERFFERIRQFSERGIEVDPDKIRVILDMPAPRTEREVRGFLGRLQYISRFIARLIDICEPIFRLLRKSQPTVWDDQCQRAFKRIREYLLSPPVLAPPTPGRPLLLYLSVSNVASGYMLAQLDDSGKDRAIYYPSKRMLDYETRYVMIERYCLALVWVTRRLRHYMTEYSVHLISRLDPLRYLFDRPALVGRLMRWLVLLTEFDIHYVTQKSVRGSIVANHLASLPVSDGRAINDDFPNEDVAVVTSLSGWRMYFDGAANHSGYGIGVLLISPHETALELGIRQMEVFGDSNLVLRQIQGEWKTRDVKLRPYHAYLELLVRRFGDLRYTHLPRAQNQFSDALATLASMIDIPADAIVRPLLIESRSAPAYCCLIEDTEIDNGLPWYHDIYHFLRLGVYPETATAKDKRALRQASADRVMREVHARVCGPHMGGHMLAQLHALTSPWPFSVWGIDIIGKISPKSSSGHEFILVAIDYFTKWVEAASYARLTSCGVASFIRSHIICRYGVPHELISDRGSQTNGAVEAVNKNIKRILQRMVETSQDWSEKLPFALWAYWTSFRTSTGATPYSLVYGMEAVLPVEIEMDERRLRAADHVRAYQRKMARAFKKRVKPRPLRIGDLVLKVIRGLIIDPRGKFRPNWSGPYFIRELTLEGAAWLMDLDGNRFSELTNVDQLKSTMFETMVAGWVAIISVSHYLVISF
ncbi:Retrovirus-related Pol polyprotein from transposon 17.6 [Vitis vinifera]|uniref:Retrovirus-related Pol polyprotein from transposon 17.6 n=1 Tax=Vitis vinifera TaxID=29760 RepID=A0A438I780_VITVI|nr:Retrovirus-related Pol polyprotein from transposon 17.6 [Vitis vinifera]